MLGWEEQLDTDGLSLSQDEGRRAAALVNSEAYIYLPNGVGLYGGACPSL